MAGSEMGVDKGHGRVPHHQPHCRCPLVGYVTSHANLDNAFTKVSDLVVEVGTNVDEGQQAKELASIQLDEVVGGPLQVRLHYALPYLIYQRVLLQQIRHGQVHHLLYADNNDFREDIRTARQAQPSAQVIQRSFQAVNIPRAAQHSDWLKQTVLAFPRLELLYDGLEHCILHHSVVLPKLIAQHEINGCLFRIILQMRLCNPGDRLGGIIEQTLPGAYTVAGIATFHSARASIL
mmetsp:Transcript_18033/g.29615  ORF Transcript_18033/g.29615 Transcript_18033/m.29615 type:complete len:235 (-) Transcript_18033:1473-2177(-)